jgi:hypothetical protein
LAPIALIAVLGFGFASVHASAPGRTQRSPLGPTVHVSGYPVAIANHRIVMGTNDNLVHPNLNRVLLTYNTETGHRRLLHVPRLNAVLDAHGDVAWVSAGTGDRGGSSEETHDRVLIEQVDLNSGAVLGTLDLRQLGPDIQVPESQVTASDAGVWLLTSDGADRSPFTHLVRIDPKTTTIAARQDLDSGYDDFTVDGPNGWVHGTDNTTNANSVMRAFDPMSLALGPVRNADGPGGWNCVGFGDEHYGWEGAGQELTAFDRSTCKLAKRISLAHTLTRGTTVGDMALRNNTLWVTVDRSHGDSGVPPDHVELLAIRTSDRRVLGRYPIPGAGHDSSEPRFVVGDNQIWVWLNDQMERIDTEPR